MANQSKINAVKGNVAKMIAKSATQAEIDLYVASEGLTIDDLKASKYTIKRAGFQVLGGMVGGAAAAPGAVTTPAGIALGSSMAGQAYDLVQEARGKKVPEDITERAITAGEDFALDAISPVALSKGIYGVKKVAGDIVGKARGLFKPAEYAVYKKFGIEPTASLATGSKAFAVAEHALSDFPMTADILQKRAQKNIEQITLANRFLAKEYGAILNKEEIGTLLQKASPQVLDHYSKIYNKLFSRVSQDIGNDPQSIKHTMGMLKTLIRETQTGPNSGVKALADEMAKKARPVQSLQRSITNEALEEGLPWESLKKYRTKVGDMLKSPELVSTRNIQSGDLKRLYAAMTQDMEQAALNAGEKVHARWRAANKYFEVKLNRDIPIIEDIIKKQYPEEVYDIVMRSSQKGGTRLRILRKQLKPKQWDAVAGTVLGKLGEQKAGVTVTSEKVFSPATFMTNWSKLSTSAKKALFGGSRYAKLSKELDGFVKVAGDMKAVEQLANKSRTGSVLMFYGLFQSTAGATGAMLSGPSGLLTGIGIGTMTVGLPRLTAKLLTNDKFVRWVNQGFKIAKTNPNGMPTHLGRLMVLKFKDDVQEDVNDVVKYFIGE